MFCLVSCCLTAKLSRLLDIPIETLEPVVFCRVSWNIVIFNTEVALLTMALAYLLSFGGFHATSRDCLPLNMLFSETRIER